VEVRFFFFIVPDAEKNNPPILSQPEDLDIDIDLAAAYCRLVKDARRSVAAAPEFSS